MAGLLRTFPFAGLLFPLVLGTGWAASDPTRPPEEWLNTAQGNVTADAAASRRLQSVLLPKNGRPLAIIGGVMVPLGGRYGDATLIRLSEREAVLTGPDGVTRLFLTPDVNKRMIETPAGNKVRSSMHGKETR